jgi:gamma-glutamyltranspeptidase / glutathione hydrolase
MAERPAKRVARAAGARAVLPGIAAAACVLVLAVAGCGASPGAVGGAAVGGTAAAPAFPAGWQHPVTAAAETAPEAMVVADAPLATEVGVAILRAGGNAVDATIATAFALAVVYPEAGNVGGGGFIVLRMSDGSAAALDFRETAPLAATRDMFVDAAGNLTDRSVTGHLASGVPGSVHGLWEAHRRFGSRPWAELLAPAIALAEEGFTVNARFAGWVRNQQPRLAPFAASAELFLPGGEPLREGSRWRNPGLADVLRRIAAHGPAGFYEGETADFIVAEMRRGGGIITHEDLRGYRAAWRTPVEFTYRGHRVISMPPSSSGGTTLAIIANVLEGYRLDGLGWQSEAALHATAEAMRRAFADRNHFLGDADFVRVPREALTSPAYAERLRATIDAARATPSREIRPGLGQLRESEHTTHFSIVDPHGNAVAMTTTINPGSGVTIRGAGIVMNNQMDDFAAKPGEPNMFGLVQGEANAIAPGKRMLSAMTPTIVLDGNDDVLIVTGGRGGPHIISAVFQVISNIIDHGMDVAAAVHAPRIHHQHLPDVLSFERTGIDDDRLAALRNLGHELDARPLIGHAPAILRRDGLWTAASDPRAGGKAAGF